MAKANKELQQDILDELQYEPMVDASNKLGKRSFAGTATRSSRARQA